MNIFSTNYEKSQIKEDDWFDFEKQFLLPLSLTSMFFGLISIFLNIVMGFNWVLIVVPFISIAIFLVVYLMARNGFHIGFAKWLFIFTTLIIINVVWYYNYGAHGPWFFLLILLYSYLIFMMSGKQLLLLSIILVINVLVLFYFEYSHPNVLGDYPTTSARLLDFYSAILLSGATAYVLMSIAKRLYLTQYKKAKMADKLKSSFLANMSHEIRTPLNAIVGFSNLLADGTIKENEREEYISIINNSNQTLLQLIDDILDVSLIEADQVKISKSNFLVNELMQSLEKVYLSVLEEKKKEDIHLMARLPDKWVRISSDAIRINQVMVNLLNNAIKFTHSGTIEFGFELENDRLKFFVKDSGIGIEEEHLKNLFDRFYKIEDNNKKLYRGTGIGLYLCKRIVEILGGTIHVSSEYGKGSVFYFYIPVDTMTVEPARVNNKKSGESLSEEQFSHKTVLIIEDDKSSLAYFNKVLQGMNLHVLEAETGKEGIRIFQENPEISVVLLDIQLPGASGFDILKELKNIRPDTPVIAQTAFAMSGDKENCLKAGFNDYIAKPVKKEALIKKLQNFL